MKEGKCGKWREERGNGGGNDGGERDGGGGSVVKSHRGRPKSERRTLRGKRRGKYKGLGEGDREKMASLLHNWIASGHLGLDES